jgi:outer membrane biosynthesis protein TonB
VLGVALSQRRRRVVVIDLADGPTPGRPGVVEVVHDELQLGEAVDFDRELLLARLGAGADDVAALEMLTGLVPRLPSDIELLVVALPPLGQPGALAAAGSLDRVLVLAESGRTPRVDLIASLDAIDATATASAVVLIDPSAGPVDDDPAAPPAAELTAPPVAEPVTEPVVEPAAPPIAPQVAQPAVEPAAEPIAEPVAPPAAEPIAEPVAPPAADPAVPVVEANTQPIPRVDAAQADADADAEPAPDADLDGDVQAGELDDGSFDPLSEPGRWATPPGHATVTGAALDAPSVSDEDSAETLRVAAALQTLAQEVWTRDDA